MITFKFYGVDAQRFKLDDTVWEAVEDPYDGYRSYLGTIRISDEQNCIFFSEPLADVQVLMTNKEELTGWQLVDAKDGHVWLKFGTDYSEDYYPQFVFHYEPKPEPLSWEEFISGKGRGA